LMWPFPADLMRARPISARSTSQRTTSSWSNRQRMAP